MPRGNQPTQSEGLVARRLRQFMLAILVFAMTGTLIDLVLYNHFQDYWQLIPFTVLGLAALTLIGHIAFQRRGTLRAFRVAMALLVGGGIAGMALHAQASAEFHGELDWEADRWHSAVVVLRSKVPPTLAPGELVQMGLLGLAATYRHPVNRKVDQQGDEQ